MTLYNIIIPPNNKTIINERSATTHTSRNFLERLAEKSRTKSEVEFRVRGMAALAVLYITWIG